jgi:hypothetical protein
VRNAIGVAVIVSLGCAGTRTVPVSERQPPVSAGGTAPVESVMTKAKRNSMSTATEKESSTSSAVGSERVVKPRAGADDPPRAAQSEPPEPTEVEGDVFAHCAYGPANYGEDPATDAKEDLAIVVLDSALAEICPEPDEDCAHDVRMFHVATLSESGVPYPKSLVGKRIRFKVSEFETAVTGHHHSRIMLWYEDAEDLGPASHRSLRTVWPRVKDDFIGVSCKGYPH